MLSSLESSITTEVITKDQYESPLNIYSPFLARSPPSTTLSTSYFGYSEQSYQFLKIIPLNCCFFFNLTEQLLCCYNFWIETTKIFLR